MKRNEAYTWEKTMQETKKKSLADISLFSPLHTERYVPHLDWVINSCRSTIRITMTLNTKKNVQTQTIQSVYYIEWIWRVNRSYSNECRKIFSLLPRTPNCLFCFLFLFFSSKFEGICWSIIAGTICRFHFSLRFFLACYDCEQLCWFLLIYLWKKGEHYVISFKVRITYQSAVKC